jgi:hypothetical protein
MQHIIFSAQVGSAPTPPSGSKANPGSPRTPAKHQVTTLEIQQELGLTPGPIAKSPQEITQCSKAGSHRKPSHATSPANPLASPETSKGAASRTPVSARCGVQGQSHAINALGGPSNTMEGATDRECDVTEAASLPVLASLTPRGGGGAGDWWGKPLLAEEMLGNTGGVRLSPTACDAGTGSQTQPEAVQVPKEAVQVCQPARRVQVPTLDLRLTVTQSQRGSPLSPAGPLPLPAGVHGVSPAALQSPGPLSKSPAITATAVESPVLATLPSGWQATQVCGMTLPATLAPTQVDPLEVCSSLPPSAAHLTTMPQARTPPPPPFRPAPLLHAIPPAWGPQKDAGLGVKATADAERTVGSSECTETIAAPNCGGIASLAEGVGSRAKPQAGHTAAVRNSAEMGTAAGGKETTPAAEGGETRATAVGRETIVVGGHSAIVRALEGEDAAHVAEHPENGGGTEDGENGLLTDGENIVEAGDGTAVVKAADMAADGGQTAVAMEDLEMVVDSGAGRNDVPPGLCLNLTAVPDCDSIPSGEVDSAGKPCGTGGRGTQSDSFRKVGGNKQGVAEGPRGLRAEETGGDNMSAGPVSGALSDGRRCKSNQARGGNPSPDDPAEDTGQGVARQSYPDIAGHLRADQDTADQGPRAVIPKDQGALARAQGEERATKSSAGGNRTQIMSQALVAGGEESDREAEVEVGGTTPCGKASRAHSQKETAEAGEALAGPDVHLGHGDDQGPSRMGDPGLGKQARCFEESLTLSLGSLAGNQTVDRLVEGLADTQVGASRCWISNRYLMRT